MPPKPILLSLALLTTLAYTHPPEYDESYSIFLTTPHFHPIWPTTPFTPAQVRPLYLPHTTFPQIAHNLRTNDVHPPLYFWTLLLWRETFGPTWFTARLLSVLFATTALATLARIATHLRIPPTPTILLCLTTYAFPYTSLLARNFALANLLTLLGVLLTLRHCEPRSGAAIQKRATPWLAGLSIGAATFTNDLTLFPALTTLIYLVTKSPRRALPALITFALFLPPDAYFLTAQHASRPTQFPQFSLPHTLTLLTKDSAAAWFGALPLYAGPLAPLATLLLILLATAGILYIARTRTPHKIFLTALTLATPAGLLLLAATFHTTPIEIRYLAPSLPYLSLLIASTLPPPRRPLTPPASWPGSTRPSKPLHPPTPPKKTKSFLLLFYKKAALPYLLLATQSLATAGLTLSPLTTQPQSAAAQQAAALATPTTLTLLPYGNDGTGIPGPFIATAPDALTIQLLRPNTPPNLTRQSTLLLATLALDSASRTAIAQTEHLLATTPCWRPQTTTQLIRLYRNTCATLPPH